ncbi:hypothetical protein N7522_012517 [Penicillium canescens]|nr:hypothetical protein N7522_012517 [Penicillium canescens]
MTRTKSNLLIALIYEDPQIYRDLGYPASHISHLDTCTPAEDVIVALSRLGHRVVPIPDVQTLARKLGAGEGAQWDLAVNIAAGVYGAAREAQVPAMLEAFAVPFTFSDAATMALCLEKGKTKMVLEHYGIPTSPFAIINLDRYPDKPITPNVVNSLTKGSKHASSLLDPASYPLFAKPLAEDTSKGIKQISVIHNVNQLCQAIEELRLSTRAIPAILVEKFLTGREFTVGILGTGDDAWVLGVDEIVWNDQVNGDSDVAVDVVQFATEKSKTSEDWDGIADEVPANRADPLVEQACTVALRAWRAIGCRDGGRVDIRFDASAGVANVLEINPLAGLKPEWSQLPMIAAHNGMSFETLFEHIVRSALKRAPAQWRM